MMFSSYVFRLKSVADNMMMERKLFSVQVKSWENGWASRYFMVDLLNTVLEDLEDVYHKSWSGVASDYEVFKKKSILCSRQPKAAVVIQYVTPQGKVWLYLELSSYTSLKCGWATPNISAQAITYSTTLSTYSTFDFIYM